jgi:hypothetical protein
MREPVERGSMPYSAVIQPELRAAQEARHALLDTGGADDPRAPKLTSTEPSAWQV